MIFLKVYENALQDKRIKRIRRMEHGDTYVLIYLRMQLLSADKDGHLFFDGIDDDFASEIAMELDEDRKMVADTIDALLKVGLIEQRSEVEYVLPGVSECVDSESDSAKRVRKHRANKMLHCNADCNANVTDSVTNEQKCNADCNTNVTEGVTSVLQEKKEKEKEESEKTKEKEKNQKKEKEKESEKKKQEEKRDLCPPLTPPVDCQAVVQTFNRTCLSLPKVQTLTDRRKNAIKARAKEYSVDTIYKVFALAEASDFLTGKRTDFHASFDWIMAPSNFVKILEGNYAGRGHPVKPNKQSGRTNFTNFNQREYDFDELERTLLNTKPSG